ncbi:MAG: biotin--[Muribaculaceae bacterium]|nr:biotin--[acetyl-CoA-carboxylase] ligase [Muribaculaceae bacterium]MBQ7205450.1 biotin--[acetyl-CoA-carboxylase] ligase [Muribaculaceae bacterium]
MPHYIKVSQTASTNTYLSRLAATLPGGTVIYTPSQTAGRGQKGNSWESKDGKNLTFSMLLKRPPVKARDQFYLSEAAAIAVVEALSAEAGDGFSVKWPNDVYWQDKKVCGMLLENSLDGSGIAHCVVGIGINVNQKRFVSDAPNPVSLTGITGREHDLMTLLKRVCARIEQLVDSLVDDSARADLHQRYMASLYRNDGQLHPYEDANGNRFMASVAGIAPDGTLTLRHEDGTCRDYLFKQVKHIINEVVL